MGNDGSRVIELGRIEDKISACQLIEKKGKHLVIQIAQYMAL